MKLLLKITALAVVAVIAYPAWLAFQVWSQSRDDEVHTADAIVVLGAAQYDGRPSPVYAARLDQAIYLFQEDLADTVILTGGKRAGDRFTEAETGRRYLAEHAVPDEAMLSETEGATTLESLENVAEIADDEGIDSVLLVSDPMHSERIKRIASDLGFEDAYTSFANYERLNRSRSTKLRELFHEVGAIVLYEILDR